MGQEEVVKLLEKSKKPLTSTEISELLDIGARSVRRILSVLKKDCALNIKFKKLSFKEKKNKYGHIVNASTIGVYYIDK